MAPMLVEMVITTVHLENALKLVKMMQRNALMVPLLLEMVIIIVNFSNVLKFAQLML